MKSYIIILLIALISCSKFLQKQKRIRDINLKSKYSIIQEEINRLFNIFLNFFPETFKSLLYLADNANFDKILNDFKELNKNADSFLKVNPFDKLVEREMKITNQLETIRYNSPAIMNYIKENKFPDDLAKTIKIVLEGQTQPIFSVNLLLKNLILAKKEFSDKQKYEKMLNDLKMYAKQLPILIKTLAVPMIEQNLTKFFNEFSKEIDKSMPEIIKNLKETFPKIQAIFHNKKKIEEFKQKYKTFYIFKNIASVEDFDIVIKAYQIIFENFLKVFKLEHLHKYTLLIISQSLNDLNIFIHGIKDRKYFVEYYINLFEKIFTTYNINNVIVDFKEAMNSLKNSIKKIEKDGLGLNSFIEKLKEKIEKMKEENIVTLCTGLLDYLKMVLTKY